MDAQCVLCWSAQVLNAGGYIISYLATRNNGNKGTAITAIDFELILQERGQVFLLGECLAHGFGKSSPGSLSQPAQVHNFRLGLEYSHLVK